MALSLFSLLLCIIVLYSGFRPFSALYPVPTLPLPFPPPPTYIFSPTPPTHNALLPLSVTSTPAIPPSLTFLPLLPPSLMCDAPLPLSMMAPPDFALPPSLAGNTPLSPFTFSSSLKNSAPLSVMAAPTFSPLPPPSLAGDALLPPPAISPPTSSASPPLTSLICNAVLPFFMTPPPSLYLIPTPSFVLTIFLHSFSWHLQTCHLKAFLVVTGNPKLQHRKLYADQPCLGNLSVTTAKSPTVKLISPSTNPSLSPSFSCHLPSLTQRRDVPLVNFIISSSLAGMWRCARTYTDSLQFSGFGTANSCDGPASEGRHLRFYCFSRQARKPVVHLFPIWDTSACSSTGPRRERLPPSVVSAAIVFIAIQDSPFFLFFF